MRLSRTQLKAPCKSFFQIECQPQDITAYGGLELIRRYFHLVELQHRIRRVFRHHRLGGDYSAVDMVLVILALVLVGGRRLEHLGYLTSDPLVQRFCGLSRIPRERSVSRWLKRFTYRSLQALVDLNYEIVCEAIEKERLPRLTIDLDGSVVTTGPTVSWAFRGFNPHHRKHRSYYPLLAHVAQTGHLLKVKNRPGNVHDSKGAVSFLREVIRELNRRLNKRLLLEFRMDGAFFQAPIIELLEAKQALYSIKVPFHKWLGLVPLIRAQQHWQALTAGMGCFEQSLEVPAWNRKLRVVVYRKPVMHETRKNYQLDLFDPDNGYFEYSAVTTNTSLSPAALWSFTAGRGAQEKTFAELKSDWAFDTVPTRHYSANSAWQQIIALGHNLLRSFQLHTAASPKPRSRKRTFSFLFHSLRTIRFKLIHQPGRILHPQGRPTLRLSVSQPAQQLIQRLNQRLVP